MTSKNFVIYSYKANVNHIEMRELVKTTEILFFIH